MNTSHIYFYLLLRKRIAYFPTGYEPKESRRWCNQAVASTDVGDGRKRDVEHQIEKKLEVPGTANARKLVWTDGKDESLSTRISGTTPKHSAESSVFGSILGVRAGMNLRLPTLLSTINSSRVYKQHLLDYFWRNLNEWSCFASAKLSRAHKIGRDVVNAVESANIFKDKTDHQGHTYCYRCGQTGHLQVACPREKRLAFGG